MIESDPDTPHYDRVDDFDDPRRTSEALVIKGKIHPGSGGGGAMPVYMGIPYPIIARSPEFEGHPCGETLREICVWRAEQLCERRIPVSRWSHLYEVILGSQRENRQW